jgi:magnesium-transporting ATPase (P-type)
LAVDEVLKRLATSIGKGRDTGEASTRLQKYGPNRLPEGKKRGPFMRFISQFNNILVYVLLGAGFTKMIEEARSLHRRSLEVEPWRLDLRKFEA